MRQVDARQLQDQSSTYLVSRVMGWILFIQSAMSSSLCDTDEFVFLLKIDVSWLYRCGLYFCLLIRNTGYGVMDPVTSGE